MNATGHRATIWPTRSSLIGSTRVNEPLVARILAARRWRGLDEGFRVEGSN